MNVSSTRRSAKQRWHAAAELDHLGAAVDLLIAVGNRDRIALPLEPSPRGMQLRYFPVIAEPVSTCVQPVLALRPRQSPRLVTKYKYRPCRACRRGLAHYPLRSFARRTDSSRSGSADLLRREPSREIGAHIVKRFAQPATLPLREGHDRVLALA